MEFLWLDIEKLLFFWCTQEKISSSRTSYPSRLRYVAVCTDVGVLCIVFGSVVLSSSPGTHRTESGNV